MYKTYRSVSGLLHILDVDNLIVAEIHMNLGCDFPDLIRIAYKNGIRNPFFSCGLDRFQNRRVLCNGDRNLLLGADLGNQFIKSFAHS